MFKKKKERLARFACRFTWSSITKTIAVVAGVVYFFCMILWPVWNYRDWVEIQAIWDRWQALNVGILAFSASVLAWYAAYYRSRRNDEKDYQAAKVFLIFVAGELCREFEKSAGHLKERLESSTWEATSTDGLAFPQRLNSYFERYIKYAEPKSAQYIIDLIKEL